MPEIRVACVAAGADLGGPPAFFAVYDTEARTTRYEKNPDYVKPPPPTALDEARWAVQEAENALRRAQGDLRYAQDELAALSE
jgi:hypothetical protein